MPNITSPNWRSPDFLWPAPAKINLFLHIIGRRADGYHLLQTAFQFLGTGDDLQFDINHSGHINRSTDNHNIPPQQDLVIKAATQLQQHTQCSKGVDIYLKKTLPIGGGLGGGSSNAATTLVALNQLWNTQLSIDDLSEIGLSLGADVPIFIHGHAAWAEGIGEKFTAFSPHEPWYLLIAPNVRVDTRTIFSSPELTRDQQPITIRDFLAGRARNICQEVVSTRYPQVGKAIAWLSQYASPHMTGTGACVFASFATEQEAQHIAMSTPPHWRVFVTKGQNISPLNAINLIL